MEAIDLSGARSSDARWDPLLPQTRRMAWFCRLWAIAALAHVIGNGPNATLMDSPALVQVSMFLLGLAALATLLAPASRTVVGTLAALVLVTAWFEAPFLGSHWLLAALVSVLLLAAVFLREPWAFFAPSARWLLVAFYSFAAFAKLNTDFFDPVVSCGRFYANQGLGAIGLPELSATGPLAHVPGVVGAAVELSVVPLLLLKPTRRYGIGLAMAFHLVLSFDLDQHFYDFTSVLLALFSLFLAESTLDRLASWQPGERLKGLMPGILLAFVYLSVSDPGTGTAGVIRHLAFVLWIPVGGLIVWHSLKNNRQTGSPASLGRPSGLGLAIVLLAVFIGAMPYLGLRTATAWNMYSNLQTYDGSTNHFIVRAEASLLLDASDFVEILETDDDKLEVYVGSGLSVPTANLRHYLADNPETTVVLAGTDGRVVPPDDWARRQSVLTRKFLFSRAVDTTGAAMCQSTFPPAG